VRISILHILFISLVLVFGEGLAELEEMKGKIAGASHVNLRAGPGTSHPPIKILRIGEEVDVERLEGNWYRVSLPDGKSGYVYKPLVYLSGHEEAESIQAGNAPEQEPGVPKEIAVKGLNCIPVDMQCKGTLAQVFEFQKQMQKLDRLVRIEHIKLANDSDFTGEVSLQTKVVIYYRPKSERG